MTNNIANTILDQLGGRRFVAMTGARHIIGHENALQFQLPRGAKDGINAVRIKLEASDTYTVIFYKRSAAIATLSDVYADSLQAVFTSNTGLDTHL